MAALELTTNKNGAPHIGAQFFFLTMLRQHSQYVGFSFRVLASVRLGLVLGLWVRVWVMVRPVRRTCAIGAWVIILTTLIFMAMMHITLSETIRKVEAWPVMLNRNYIQVFNF